MIGAKVIKITPGNNKTGNNGSLNVSFVDKYGHHKVVVLIDLMRIVRTKYINEEGEWINIPEDEGKFGMIAFFARLKERDEGADLNCMRENPIHSNITWMQVLPKLGLILKVYSTLALTKRYDATLG